MTRPAALPLTPAPADHGGGIDAARARWGGSRADWLDLSTGINPVAYPLPAHRRPRHGRNCPTRAQRTRCSPPPGASGPSRTARRSSPRPAPRPSSPASGARPPRHRSASPARPTTSTPAPSPPQGWVLTDGALGRARPGQPQQPRRPDVAGKGRDRAPHHPGRELCRPRPGRQPDRAGHPPRRAGAQGARQVLGPRGPAPRFRHRRPRPVDRLPALLGPWPVSGPALAIGTAALCRHRLGQRHPRAPGRATPRASTGCLPQRARRSSAAPRFTASHTVPDAAPLARRVSPATTSGPAAFPIRGPGCASACRGPRRDWSRLATALETSHERHAPGPCPDPRRGPGRAEMALVPLAPPGRADGPGHRLGRTHRFNRAKTAA